MATTTRAVAALLVASVAMASPAAAQSSGAAAGAPVRACTLLTDAQVQKLINRGQQAYGEPEGLTVGSDTDTVCQYPIGAQVVLFAGRGSQERFERFLQRWKQDKVPRRPVSGIGDRAWIMFPPTQTQYQDRVAYLVTNVGQHTVAVSMAAKDGAADGPMMEYCRRGQLSKEECAEIEASKSETVESLQPAVEAVARAVLANLR